MIKLSVIIPTYNRGAFLAPCVESIRAAGTEAEIIIVDDGSTDDTTAQASKLDDVTLIRQPNTGPAVARNTGFARSRGEFVSFLDSDDTWRPGVVGRLIAVMEQHPDVELAYANALVGSPADGWQSLLDSALGRGEFDAIPSISLGNNLRRLDRAAFFRRSVSKNQIFLGSAVIRRSAVLALKGFDPELFGGEDYEFALRLAHRAPVVYLDEPLANYLKHPVSISANLDRMDREFAKVMRKLLDKCSELSSEEREFVNQRRRLLMYYLAYNAYDRGEIELARQRLHDLISEFGPCGRTLSLLAKCRLPGGVLRRLRRLKRFVAGAAS